MPVDSKKLLGDVLAKIEKDMFPVPPSKKAAVLPGVTARAMAENRSKIVGAVENGFANWTATQEQVRVA